MLKLSHDIQEEERRKAERKDSLGNGDLLLELEL